MAIELNNDSYLKDTFKDFSLDFQNMEMRYEGTGNSAGVGKKYLLSYFPVENKIKYSYGYFGDTNDNVKYSFMNHFKIDYERNAFFDLYTLLESIINRNYAIESIHIHLKDFLSRLDLTPEFVLQNFETYKVILNEAIERKLYNLEFDFMANHRIVTLYQNYIYSKNGNSSSKS